jgi:hypothetical protein
MLFFLMMTYVGVIALEGISLIDLPDSSSVATVYHGSQKVVEKPVFGFGNPNNDYGLGFYMTKNKGLAGEWAVLDSGFDGYINEYTLDYSGMNVLNLDKEPIEIWVAVLMKNRKGKFSPAVLRRMKKFLQLFNVDVSKYDIIHGYRADDSYFSFVEDFLSGDISKEELQQALKLGDLGTQVCLKSIHAFNNISFVKIHKASASRFYDSAYIRDTHARAAYQKLIEHSDGQGTKIADMIGE